MVKNAEHLCAICARSARTASRCGRRRGTPPSSPSGCRRPASRRSSSTATTTCSRSTRSASGSRRRSSRPFATGGSGAAASSTTRGRSTSTRRRSSPSSRRRGKLPINLKLIVEGEEEIGSENLDIAHARAGEGPRGRLRLRERHGDVRARHPVALRRAARARCTSRCTVDGPKPDLHSGSFGGGVANPVNALAKMIAHAPRRRRAHHSSPASTTTSSRSPKPSAHEIASLPFDETEWLRSTGLPGRLRREGLLDARAHLGAADARLLRHRRRLPGRRREDDHPGARASEDQLPARPPPGAGRDRAEGGRLPEGDRAAGRPRDA